MPKDKIILDKEDISTTIRQLEDNTKNMLFRTMGAKTLIYQEILQSEISEKLYSIIENSPGESMINIIDEENNPIKRLYLGKQINDNPYERRTYSIPRK